MRKILLPYNKNSHRQCKLKKKKEKETSDFHSDRKQPVLGFQNVESQKKIAREEKGTWSK